MITSTFLFIIGLVLNVLASFLGALTFLIPIQITEAIEWAFSQLAYLDFLLPMNTLMTVLGVFVTFLVYWYSTKIILWIYHLMRHGSNTSVAKTHSDHHKK